MGLTAENLEADRKKIRSALTVTLGILVLVWGVFVLDRQFGLDLNRFGNRPGRLDGLQGIFTMPFLHGGLDHIWNNTVSFFTLCSMLLYFYGSTGLKALFWSWLGAGIVLWSSFAPGNHIGLSGVVYALAAFLFAGGVLRRNRVLMRVALVVVFLYGSIIWGVLPIEVGVSWQGHLSGAAVGLLLALILRKEGPVADRSRADALTETDYEAPAQTAQGTALRETRMMAEANTAVKPNRREALLWKGERKAMAKPRPLSSRGIRKPRSGPHLKSRR